MCGAARSPGGAPERPRAGGLGTAGPLWRGSGPGPPHGCGGRELPTPGKGAPIVLCAGLDNPWGLGPVRQASAVSLCYHKKNKWLSSIV